MKHIKAFENQDPINLESGSVIKLEDYTTEDKIKFFDKMYKLASDTLSETKRDNYKDDDTDHWFFEEGFSILNLKDKKKLWHYFNNLSK